MARCMVVQKIQLAVRVTTWYYMLMRNLKAQMQPCISSSSSFTVDAAILRDWY